MDVRYGLQTDISFEVDASVRYGLQTDVSFDVIDGYPAIVDSIYCLDQYGNPLNSLDDTLKIGSNNIYDDPRGWTGLASVEYRYGVNNSLCPNSYIDVAPAEGLNFHLFSPVVLAAGDIVYFKIIVIDGFGNITDLGLFSVVVEGVPVRYGLQGNIAFSVIEEIILGRSNEVIMMSPAEFPKRHLKIF
ncbi:hypothetical protein KKG24_04665 [Patescibacteria group bacterium]|nr:hypothetical protein [Patescibacteria group bacterium]